MGRYRCPKSFTQLGIMCKNKIFLSDVTPGQLRLYGRQKKDYMKQILKRGEVKVMVCNLKPIMLALLGENEMMDESK